MSVFYSLYQLLHQTLLALFVAVVDQKQYGEGEDDKKEHNNSQSLSSENGTIRMVFIELRWALVIG